MKVDFPSGYNAYRKTQVSATPKGQLAGGAHKTDIADFSRGSVSVPDKALLGAKTAVQSGINAPADAARLEELRRSIKEGSYNVPSEVLAAAILGMVQ